MTMPIAVPNHASSSRHQGPSSSAEPASPRRKPVIIEEGWTTETFINRPVKLDAVSQISSIRDKLNEILMKIDDGITLARETAIAIEEAEKDNESLEDVVDIFQRSLEQKRIIQIKIEVLKSISDRLRAKEEELVDLDKIFRRETEGLTEEYMTKSDRAKFKDDPAYIDLRQTLWEIHHHNTACPGMSKWLKAGPDEDSDDDVETGGMTQMYICPLTKGVFQHAVKNTNCKHTYSRQAILDHISNSGRRSAKCPVASCSAVVGKDTLKDDTELQKRADTFVRRQRRREEEEDVDVVDID